ncbi:RNA polymerase sigma factor [Agromyces cerinus]|uniref:RNA polymerase sigma-70 factor, ECF subfamily n=1 Tax=Agromyces cerinus subsp. cerinus TaxID=232089 RepID=A0A1N6EQP8_9MICO|nr:sigma-70 family RNA polymerase sigma factor [Agromyces cerinus]SIN85366.1 RNA polymerase sigma-70 factor, ECF subfamily [Agromyces cerinus subsp. cerinus]
MSRRQGHDDALERIIAQNLSDLLVFAERRVPHRPDAADALGDALEIVWRRSARVPSDPTAARMYLFVVLRNVIANATRSRRRRSAALERLRTELSVQRTPDPDVRLDVAAAIARLPPPQAELVRLIHWDGFSIAEAATMLSINASTARGKYARARETLKQALATPEQQPRAPQQINTGRMA